MPRYFGIALCCLLMAVACTAQTGASQEPQKQSIHGKVLEAKSEEPIRKVNVSVIGGTERYSAITGADGTFTIENIQAGTYMVALERAGFVQAATSRQQQAFTVQAGQSLSGLVFRMQAAGLISGKIVDMDGDPMAGVSVAAISTSTRSAAPGRARSSSATTNDLGEYRIADLRSGKYLVLAQPSRREVAPPDAEQTKTKGRLIYSSTFYPGTLDKSQAVTVEVHSGQESAANFGLLTSRGYRVSGTVSGIPSGAMVQLMLFAKSGIQLENGNQQLHEGGEFHYDDVQPGTYLLHMIVLKGLFTGKPPDLQVVELSPSIEVDKADVEGVQLHAEPGGEIHGKFRLDTGEKFDWTELYVGVRPIAENVSESMGGAMMSPVFSKAGTNSAVNSDGSFELKSVPGGSYQLMVMGHSDHLRDYYTKTVMLGGRDVADSGFVVNGDTYLDVVVSPKGATIEGNVVDDKGQPVANALVVTLPNTEHRARPDSYQQQLTDEHGYFTVRGLNPGSYVVVAFEELQEEARGPEFLKKYGGNGEKVELEEGVRKRVTAKIIPAEPEVP